MKLKLLLGLASILTACSSQPTIAPAQPQENEPQMTWHDVTKHGFINESKAEGKTVINAIKKTLSDNQSAHLLFKMGDIAFVRVDGSPQPDIMDENGSKAGYYAVFISEPNQIVKLPAQTLFSQFSSEIRKNPDALRLDRRVKTMLLLALGDEHFITPEQDKNHAPSWDDNNSKLIVQFFRQSGNGSMTDGIEKCLLTVDENQKHQLNCTPEKSAE